MFSGLKSPKVLKVLLSFRINEICASKLTQLYFNFTLTGFNKAKWSQGIVT